MSSLFSIFNARALPLVILAWPLLTALILQILMGVADTIMAGQYSATDMAAVAIGVSIINPMQFFIQGVAMALVPAVAHINKAGEREGVSTLFQHMLLILCLLACVLLMTSHYVATIVRWFDVPANMFDITVDYVKYMLLSLPFFAVYQACRQTCEGLGVTLPSMYIMALGLLINIPANYVFIYGFAGIPAMGGAGCGLASCVVFIGMSLATVLYTLYSKTMQPLKLWQFKRISVAPIASLLSVGIPVALTFLTEVTLFAAVALLIAPLGVVSVAAHQIAINFSSLVFMIPLSIGMACAIRLGTLKGQGRTNECVETYWTAITLALLIAITTALLTVIFSHFIVRIYTDDSQVWPLAMQIMFLGALFQISDSIQVVSANALRGYRDTRWLFIIAFISYWLIGLPLGYALGLTNIFEAFFPNLGVKGFWIAIIIGLSLAAIGFALRIRIYHKKF